MSSQITDPEVHAFIERTLAAYPADAMEQSVAQQRSFYQRLCESFARPQPIGIAVEDGVIDTGEGFRPVRRYWPSEPGPARVLYFHGGGFVVGNLESHDDICAEIAQACGSELVAVDYRLCPEHPHPAAYQDALAAALHLSDRPLIVVGDSAGGNLAAAVALNAKVRILGQVLIYPGLGGEADGLASYHENAEAPLLSTDDVIAYRRIRAGHDGDPDDPTFSPLRTTDLSRSPPAFVSAAECDPLRDDGPTYVLRLTDAGVPAECVVEPELPHGHLRARHMSARAGAAFGRICAAISAFAADA